MSKRESLLPNWGKLELALRSIGYTFEAAVADIVDNSIDARARNVVVRIIARKDGHLDLAFWDDGEGMTGTVLKEAMRFGADVSQDLERLGKFGLGLKLASLSQAKELRVITAHGGALSGRGWLENGISDAFECTIFLQNECKQMISEIFPDRPLRQSGTLVWWSHLYRLGSLQVRSEEHTQRLMHRLEQHLALAFHRFLAGRPRKVSITLDIFDQGAARAGIPMALDPMDPFDYEQSASPEFPAAMALAGSHRGLVSIKAHIWPANSSSPSYRLPGGANSRQGFYFYRNNRLIQGGGWNGIREAEPHSSLARLEIDVAAGFDLEVSLDVKKVEIHLPPDLIASIQKARTSSGIDFKRYLKLADDAYRTRKLVAAELPLIPSRGLPAGLTTFLHDELRIERTKKHRDLKYGWKSLSKKMFFEIDKETGHLYLNSLFRRRLLHGLPGSSADIPVVKCLLFLVLEYALSSGRMGSRLRETTDRANRILVEAVKYERS